MRVDDPAAALAAHALDELAPEVQRQLERVSASFAAARGRDWPTTPSFAARGVLEAFAEPSSLQLPSAPQRRSAFGLNVHVAAAACDGAATSTAAMVASRYIESATTNYESTTTN